MSSLYGLLLVLLIAGVLFVALKADKHYRHMHTKGRQDYIRHDDHSAKLEGLNRWTYRRGQQVQKELMEEDL